MIVPKKIEPYTMQLNPPAEFYRTLTDALEELDAHEVFYLEYSALKIYELLEGAITSQSAILDIGSGHGLLTRLMQTLSTSPTVYGIDIDSDAVAYAQNQYPSITFAQSKKTAIPFPKGMVDIVYANVVFHHLSPEDRIRYCAEIDRVLKPGGAAIIIELNPYSPSARQAFRDNPHDQKLEMLDAAILKKELAAYGKTTVRYFGFFQTWFTRLRGFEVYFQQVPLGSLYAVILRKKC